MSDFDLTLFPQSFLSFRLGFSRNNRTGPSYSSIHEGTDAYLYQPWNTTLNSYRTGVDWKFAPRTVLSYDQFLDYYKGDTSWQLASFYGLPLFQWSQCGVRVAVQQRGLAAMCDTLCWRVTWPILPAMDTSPTTARSKPAIPFPPNA
jgi:hypothetical protein